MKRSCGADPCFFIIQWQLFGSLYYFPCWSCLSVDNPCYIRTELIHFIPCDRNHSFISANQQWSSSSWMNFFVDISANLKYLCFWGSINYGIQVTYLNSASVTIWASLILAWIISWGSDALPLIMWGIIKTKDLLNLSSFIHWFDPQVSTP